MQNTKTLQKKSNIVNKTFLHNVHNVATSFCGYVVELFKWFQIP